jgi:hypothetical protein
MKTKLLVLIMVCMLCTVLLSACSEKTESRCTPASDKQIARIRSAIQDNTPGNDIDHLYAVKSNDFERVYMVAGNITGDGIKPGDAIGVWALSGDPDGTGLTMSVDQMAFEFSDYGLGSTTTAEITMQSDGAEESKKCVEDSLK